MFYLRKTGCLAQTAGPMHVGQPSPPFFLGLLTGVLAAFSIPYWRWRVLHLRVGGERGGRAACLRACMWRARLGLGLQPPPVWQTRTWIMCAAFWADSKQAQMRIDTSPHTAVTNQITDYVPHILSTLACPLQHPVTAEGPPKLSDRFTQQGVFFAYKTHHSFYATHQSKTQAFRLPYRILQCAEVGGPLMVTGCCATSLTPTFLVPPHCHSYPIPPSFFHCPF